MDTVRGHVPNVKLPQFIENLQRLYMAGFDAVVDLPIFHGEALPEGCDAPVEFKLECTLRLRSPEEVSAMQAYE
jgi:hypothetical protein